MESELRLRLVLVEPPAGVDYGVQKGSGDNYETLFVQRRTGRDVAFEFPVTVKNNRSDGSPHFLGPLTQGPSSSRFIYIDVGTYAGQRGTQWARRMKIPLHGITWPLIRKACITPGGRLMARIPGTAKDGGPNAATVTLLDGWTVVTHAS